jgi:DNA-binding MarR family transcriptional regulator
VNSQQERTGLHGKAPQRLASRKLAAPELRRLSEFRFQLRRFLHFSQEAAEAVGLRAQQYQLLLAVCGMPEGEEPTIAAVAGRLLLKHNSTVELVDRTIEQGLLRRVHDPVDQRRILLRVSDRGERLMQSLASFHLEELGTTGPALLQSLRGVLRSGERRARAHKSTAKDAPAV